MELEFTTKVLLPKDRSEKQLFLQDKILFPEHEQLRLDKKEIIRITQSYIKLWDGSTNRAHYQYLMEDIAEPLVGENPMYKSTINDDEIDEWIEKKGGLVKEIFPNFHQVFFKGEGLPESVYIYISPETYKTLYDWLWKTPNHEEI